MKIKSAAIQSKCGKLIFVGRSHAEIFEAQPKNSLKGGTQGFITDDGNFVNRKEAAKIAYIAKQIPKPVTVLFSEDLTGDWPWKKELAAAETKKEQQ